MKVWGMKTHRRKSILEVDEEYWSCEFDVNYKNRRPLFVSSVIKGQIAITYEDEVVVLVLFLI